MSWNNKRKKPYTCRRNKLSAVERVSERNKQSICKGHLAINCLLFTPRTATLFPRTLKNSWERNITGEEQKDHFVQSNFWDQSRSDSLVLREMTNFHKDVKIKEWHQTKYPWLFLLEVCCPSFMQFFAHLRIFLLVLWHFIFSNTIRWMADWNNFSKLKHLTCRFSMSIFACFFKENPEAWLSLTKGRHLLTLPWYLPISWVMSEQRSYHLPASN